MVKKEDIELEIQEVNTEEPADETEKEESILKEEAAEVKEHAKKAIQKLYLKVIEINEQSLPNDEGVRYNIILKKEKKTEKRYPRSWAEIQKKPL